MSLNYTFSGFSTLIFFIYLSFSVPSAKSEVKTNVVFQLAKTSSYNLFQLRKEIIFNIFISEDFFHKIKKNLYKCIFT